MTEISVGDSWLRELDRLRGEREHHAEQTVHHLLRGDHERALRHARESDERALALLGSLVAPSA